MVINANSPEWKVQAQQKVASWDGKVYFWVDPRYVILWTSGEFYGRVHHITGDLEQIEKVLQKAKFALLDGFRDNKITCDPSDIIVDGLPGGRNKMLVYCMTGSYREPWTPQEIATITEFTDKLSMVSGSKKSPQS